MLPVTPSQNVIGFLGRNAEHDIDGLLRAVLLIRATVSECNGPHRFAGRHTGYHPLMQIKRTGPRNQCGPSPAGASLKFRGTLRSWDRKEHFVDRD